MFSCYVLCKILRAKWEVKHFVSFANWNSAMKILVIQRYNFNTHFNTTPDSWTQSLMAPCFSCTLPAWCWCTGSCGWQTGWGLQPFCSCSDHGPWGDGPNVWTESPRSRQPTRPVFLPVKHTAQRAVRTSYKKCLLTWKAGFWCLSCIGRTVTDI